MARSLNVGPPVLLAFRLDRQVLLDRARVDRPFDRSGCAASAVGLPLRVDEVAADELLLPDLERHRVRAVGCRAVRQPATPVESCDRLHRLSRSVTEYALVEALAGGVEAEHVGGIVEAAADEDTLVEALARDVEGERV